MIKSKKTNFKILLLMTLVIYTSESFAEDGPGAPRQQMGKFDTKATKDYVHSWLKFPVIKGTSIFNSHEVVIEHHKGDVNIIVFLSSSNVPTQQLIESFLALEKKYAPRHTKFFYIFTADLKTDASGFAREFNMNTNNAILANSKILKQFKNPGPPTIFIADRRGWFADRFKKVDRKSLRQIDYLLARMTAN